MKDSAVRNPSAAHRPHQKRKRVRRRRIFRAVARCALSVTEAGPLFPDSFLGVDTPLSSSPEGFFHLVKALGGNCIKAGFNSREKLATSKEDTMENLEVEIITATKVADEDRLNFWLRHVGMTKMLSFERHVFCWMREALSAL